MCCPGDGTSIDWSSAAMWSEAMWGRKVKPTDVDMFENHDWQLRSTCDWAAEALLTRSQRCPQLTTDILKVNQAISWAWNTRFPENLVVFLSSILMARLFPDLIGTAGVAFLKCESCNLNSLLCLVSAAVKIGMWFWPIHHPVYRWSSETKFFLMFLFFYGVDLGGYFKTGLRSC